VEIGIYIIVLTESKNANLARRQEWENSGYGKGSAL
jgi:hypothetical protein